MTHQSVGPRTATLFSGGGLVEEALRGAIEPVFAVDFDTAIGEAYRIAHGDHIRIEDVCTVDFADALGAEYLHASPVCKNFSAAKKLRAGEQPIDVATAEATVRGIEEIKPGVFTLENVPAYAKSGAFGIITDALTREGYTWDVNVLDAADYGAATRRARLLLRAVREGELPPLPAKVPATDWYATVADLVPDLPRVAEVPEWMAGRLTPSGIDWRTIDRPLIVMGGSAFKGTVPHAFAGGPAPTIKATWRERHLIVLPGGEVRVVTPRVLARIMGIPDSYPLPDSRAVATTIIGNGLPAALTRAVFGPLLLLAVLPSTRMDG